MGARVVCLRGANVYMVADLVKGDAVKGQTLDIAAFDIVVFHVGTNDIGDDSAHIKDAFCYLLEVTRQRNPQARVFMSEILPRRRDHHYTAPQVKAINKWLKRWAAAEGCYIIDGYHLFFSKRGDLPAFLFGDDLHFSPEGCRKFIDRLRHVLRINI